MERLTTPTNRLQVRGFLTIHSTPSALRHHIDWAIQAVLGTWIKPVWSAQPLTPGSFRMQLEFRDRQGVAGELASSLRSWHYLNFEIIENSDNGGELFRCTPELGIHRAVVDQSGAVVLTENQLTSVIKNAFDEDSLREGISTLMGTPWDLELDRFRSVDLQEVAHLRAI
jgi:hypothetical protein